MSTIRFEKCDCSKSKVHAHGYFYEGEQKAAIPTMSMEVGRAKLSALAEKYGLSTGEVAEVEEQLRTVGLRDTAEEGERQLVALAEQAEEMGVPFELLLAFATAG
jgi:hypothetical protein